MGIEVTPDELVSGSKLMIDGIFKKFGIELSDNLTVYT